MLAIRFLIIKEVLLIDFLLFLKFVLHVIGFPEEIQKILYLFTSFISVEEGQLL